MTFRERLQALTKQLHGIRKCGACAQLEYCGASQEAHNVANALDAAIEAYLQAAPSEPPHPTREQRLAELREHLATPGVLPCGFMLPDKLRAVVFACCLRADHDGGHILQ